MERERERESEGDRDVQTELGDRAKLRPSKVARVTKCIQKKMDV
jgi:hypothetical protein